MRKTDKTPKFEYYEFSLHLAIRWYIEKTMSKNPWEIVALDINKDLVVVKYFHNGVPNDR